MLRRAWPGFIIASSDVGLLPGKGRLPRLSDLEVRGTR